MLERLNPRSAKTVILVVFGIILLVLIGLTVSLPNNQLVQNYAPNFLSEDIGILATVFFVDWLINRELERHASKLREIAARKVGEAAKNIALLFSEMIKASMKEPFPHEKLPDNFDELFVPAYTKNLEYLDMQGTAPVIPKKDWYAHCAGVIKKNLESMTRILETYIPYLRADLIQSIEDLQSDAGLGIIQTLQVLPEINKEQQWNHQYMVFGSPDVRNLVEDSISKVHRLLNKISEEYKVEYVFDQGLWGTNIAPKFGASRVEVDWATRPAPDPSTPPLKLS